MFKSRGGRGGSNNQSSAAQSGRIGRQSNINASRSRSRSASLPPARPVSGAAPQYASGSAPRPPLRQASRSTSRSASQQPSRSSSRAPNNPFADRNRYSSASSGAASNPFSNSNCYSSGSSHQGLDSRGRPQFQSPLAQQSTGGSSRQGPSASGRSQSRQGSRAPPIMGQAEAQARAAQNFRDGNMDLFQALRAGPPGLAPQKQGRRSRITDLLRRRPRQ